MIEGKQNIEKYFRSGLFKKIQDVHKKCDKCGKIFRVIKKETTCDVCLGPGKRTYMPRKRALIPKSIKLHRSKKKGMTWKALRKIKFPVPRSLERCMECNKVFRKIHDDEKICESCILDPPKLLKKRRSVLRRLRRKK